MSSLHDRRLLVIGLLFLLCSVTGWASDEQASLTLSSNLGGMIVAPSGSPIVDSNGQWIDIEAQSTDPNYFVFSGWSGSAVDAGYVSDPNQAQTTVYLQGTQDLQACFATTLNLLYVNSNAGDVQVGTSTQPLASLQDAIELATDEMQIWVRPGRYSDPLNFQGKNLALIAYGSSQDEHPVIDCNGPEPSLSFTQGEEGCVIQGFTITQSLGSPGGAVYCSASHPSFYNCIFVGNRCGDPNGGVILLDHSQASWSHCTLVDNAADTGLFVLQESSPSVSNCIIWDNSPTSFVYDSNSTLNLSYCNVESLNHFQEVLAESVANFTASPSFVDPGYWGHADNVYQALSSDDPNAVWIEGDYHLQSDDYDIDRGNPSATAISPTAVDIDGQPRIQNNRVDIGADETIPEEDLGIFECSVLKEAVMDALWLYDDPTPEDMLELVELYFYGSSQNGRITSLAGLEYATNLQILEATHNKFSDLSPLAGLSQLQRLVINNNNNVYSLASLSGLTRLEHLDFHDNKVSDLTPLAGLTNLRLLIPRGNKVTDITALAGLVNMEELHLMQNSITDLSALLSMTQLETLYVNRNPLSAESCNTIIPQIVANNPGLTNLTHSCDPIKVTLSSTAGGSIVNPGEGDFWYNYGDIVYIQAQADSGYEFNGFSGNYSGGSNPASVTVLFEMSIKANFVAAD